jgi:hypothetical protein
MESATPPSLPRRPRAECSCRLSSIACKSSPGSSRRHPLRARARSAGPGRSWGGGTAARAARGVSSRARPRPCRRGGSSSPLGPLVVFTHALRRVACSRRGWRKRSLGRGKHQPTTTTPGSRLGPTRELTAVARPSHHADPRLPPRNGRVGPRPASPPWASMRSSGPAASTTSPSCTRSTRTVGACCGSARSAP